MLLFGCEHASKNKNLENSEESPLVTIPTQIATLEYEIAADLGEGAFWNHETQTLFWVDIEGKLLHIYDPETKVNRSFPTPSRIGTVVPQNDTTAVVALEDGIYLMDLQTGALSLLSDVEAELHENRFNDGKCDPNGNLWVGSMRMDESQASAALYRVNSEGETKKMLENITISNGIVWSNDHTKMYYIDTPTTKVRVFDYDKATAEISNEQTVIEVPATMGYPDGMAIDAEGMLWVALWNGNSVVRYHPETGAVLQKIEVPAHNVTSCAFGGKDLSILYITTASRDMNASEKMQYPLAGSLFQVVPGVKGVKSNFFGKE